MYLVLFLTSTLFQVKEICKHALTATVELDGIMPFCCESEDGVGMCQFRLMGVFVRNASNGCKTDYTLFI